MIKIKCLIARTIKNIGKLTAFALLVIPSFAICCLLGSWTIDANGNLIGENLFNQVSISQNNTWHMYIRDLNLKPNTTYTITNYTSWNALCSSCQVIDTNDTNYTLWTNVYNNNKFFSYSVNSNGIVFTTPTSNYNIKTIYFQFASQTTLPTLNNLQIMLNEGNTPKEWEPYGVYYSSQNYYDLQTQYNQALEGTEIDYTNYTIELVNYPTSDTTSNYNVVQTLTTRDYVNEQGFLNIYDIIQISGFGNTWDGIVVTSSQYLNTYNYNLLFNGSGNSNLDFGLYYKYYESEKFRKISLMNIVGDSAYYGYFDLINLFGKNAIDENIQDILYNKFAIHWTNNPTPNDLINIKLNSTDGYNMGYAKGVQDNLINLEELNETIEEQTRQLQEKQKKYDTLLEHYNNAQLDNPLSSMVVAVADIPLNLFHSMFNFDIMGFNLAAFILGIITILLVAYVIKLFL